MTAREPTWFVRLRGHTLGPLSIDELRKTVREGEIGPDDKLNRAGELAWRRLAEYPELLADWEKLRRPAFVADLPSPNLLWKKPRAAAPLPDDPPRAAASVPAELPATIPTPPPALDTKAPPPRREPAPPPAEKTARPKKAARKAGKKGAKKTPRPPAPIAREAPVAAPVEARLPASETKPVPPPGPGPAAEVPASPRAGLLFPVRPEVPPVEADPRPASPPARRLRTRPLRFAGNRRKILRRAALAGLLAVVAATAYWAGQKTRDPKELPLPDPSSPTTQLPAAGDPIQPLRAPTRPRRD